MKELTIPTPVFLPELRRLPFSGYGWSMVMRVCQIGTIACPQRNTPPVVASAAEATTFFSVWRSVRMGLFSFGLGMSMVGG